MKSTTEYLAFKLPGRFGLLNITPQVENVVKTSGVQEGLCLVNAMHIALHT
jgi:thiamine phosphate synthase YjbQ (UPF0047 family)